MAVVVAVTPVPVFLLIFGTPPIVIFMTAVRIGFPAIVVAGFSGAPSVVVGVARIVIPCVHSTTANQGDCPESTGCEKFSNFRWKASHGERGSNSLTNPGDCKPSVSCNCHETCNLSPNIYLTVFAASTYYWPLFKIPF